MTVAPAVVPASPYRGLAAFDETDLDASLFFGRERETAVIAANVMAARFTVLYGPLGVGKSSVLHAGVARRLRSLAPDANVVVHDSWAGDPGRGLLSSVASALGVDTPSPDMKVADGLADMVAESGLDLFLLLDQFEEVFVYPGSEALAESLAQIVVPPDVRINVLVALREDALAELDVFTGHIRNVFGNYLRLDRLDRAAARAAVIGPVSRFNELSESRHVEIEEELVEAVLDQVQVGRVVVGGRNGGPAEELSEDRVEAPYLQLVMERIWDAEARNGSTVLRRETLDELGGAQAVVHAHLGEAVQALASDQQDVAARVFNHLVTPSGTKIAHGAEDLAEYAGVEEADLRPVLASLGANRIVRPVDGRFEIYHDVLADAVLTWRARHDAERALERERAEAERRHRRLLILLVSSLVVLGVMAAVAVYALAQRGEARDQATIARGEARNAAANQLAAEAGVLIPIAQAELNAELALALAAEATRIAPTDRAVNALRRALLLSHLRAVVPEEGVSAASFSPDGSRIVVGTKDGTAAVYADDARTLLTSMRLGNPATSVSFSPDGRLILTTEGGGPARIWDATGRELALLGNAPTAASFNSDGSLVLTVEPGGARVWRATDGSLVTTLRRPGEVRDASFGPGGLVATVGTGSIARVFDARTGKRVASVDHGDLVTNATVTRGGETLVTTGRDGIARVWSLRRGGRLVRELEGHNGPITDGVADAGGTLFVTTSTDGTARVWELPSGRSLAEFAGHAGRVDGAAFSRDSGSVVTWGAGGTARVGTPRSVTARALLAGHGDAVTSASFDPSGDFVLTTSADGHARLWRSGFDATLRPLARGPAAVSAAVFSSDGSAVAMAGPSDIEIMRTADGEPLGRVSAPAASLLALSRDGSLVASSRGPRIALQDVGRDGPADTFVADAVATALALSPALLAAGAEDGSITVWSLDGRRALDLDGAGGGVTAIGLGPTGDILIAGFSGGGIAAWSLDDGRPIYQRLEHRRGTAVTSVAFSPDGSRFVTAGADSTARVWDAATGRMLYTLHGHTGTVHGAAFDPSGHWLVTAAAATVGLWDSSTQQRLLLLKPDEGRVFAASFDTTGLKILAAGSDGVLTAYSCQIACGDVAGLLALADRRMAATGRVLTPTERRHYLGRD